MRTSPAFQFYPTDFLLGTAIFTPAEVGAYIRLLCHQWESGSVPNDVKLLARLSQSDEQTIETILVKFSSKKDGTLVNLKMEKVRKDADDYRKSRSSNGKKGGRPKKHMVSVCLPHGKHSESPPSPPPPPSPPLSPIDIKTVAEPPFSSPAFAQAWADWEQSRKETRKPLKPTAIKLQFRQLKEVGEEAAIEMLIHSAKNGYTGIFAPQQTRAGKSTNPADRNAGTTNEAPYVYRTDRDTDPFDFDLETP